MVFIYLFPFVLTGSRKFAIISQQKCFVLLTIPSVSVPKHTHTHTHTVVSIVTPKLFKVHYTAAPNVF
jgi:hypothetical protein